MGGGTAAVPDVTWRAVCQQIQRRPDAPGNTVTGEFRQVKGPSDRYTWQHFSSGTNTSSITIWPVISIADLPCP